MENITLDSFTEIPDTMRWKRAALEQIKLFRLFANSLKFPWGVAGYHTSKSIELPVVQISCPGMEVYLRDNFYDINICVVATKPITLPISVLFEGILPPLSWDWYMGEIARSRGYSWREWTDEQMDDPGLLALAPNAPPYQVKKPEEKTRWMKRLTDPEWYTRDWSHGKVVWKGEFGPGCTMWVQEHPFMQGISELVPSEATEPYESGCSGFALALSELSQAEALIKRLLGG